MANKENKINRITARQRAEMQVFLHTLISEGKLPTYRNEIMELMSNAQIECTWGSVAAILDALDFKYRTVKPNMPKSYEKSTREIAWLVRELSYREFALVSLISSLVADLTNVRTESRQACLAKYREDFKILAKDILEVQNMLGGVCRGDAGELVTISKFQPELDFIPTQTEQDNSNE